MTGTAAAGICRAMLVYKILRDAERQELLSKGATAGAPVDRRDGFVHFSTAGQVRETARKWFSGEAGLWLVACDGDRLGSDLRWEPARGGEPFPHLYRELRLSDVAAQVQLPPLSGGGFDFPPEIR